VSAVSATSSPPHPEMASPIRTSALFIIVFIISSYCLVAPCQTGQGNPRTISSTLQVYKTMPKISRENFFGGRLFQKFLARFFAQGAVFHGKGSRET
jgi:hypothetical protein